MQKTPTYLKSLAITAFLIALVGLAIAVQIPGTISFLPIALGLIFGLVAIMISKKKKVKCYASYFAVAIAIVGIAFAINNAFIKDIEVKVDEQQQEQLKKTNQEIEGSDDLDSALDDL